jgi:hypothetical protein
MGSGPYALERFAGLWFLMSLYSFSQLFVSDTARTLR